MVIAGGSLSACELAVELADQGKRVILVEGQKKVAPDCYGINRIPLARMLKDRAIQCHSLHRVIAAGADSLTAVNEAGEEVRFSGDTVISALGSVPDQALGEALMAKYPGRVLTVGACDGAGTVGSSIRSAYFAALSL